MQPDCRVAVLIPAYNAADFIIPALDSIAAQQRLPDQIVVIDDGSSDATAVVVEAWLRAHPGIPLQFYRQSNAGVAAARNRALMASDCDLIALLDADDLMEPAHLALLAGAFMRHPGLVIAFGDQAVFSEDRGRPVDSFLQGKRVLSEPHDEDAQGFRVLRQPVYSSLIWGDYIPTSGSMLRRQAVLHAGLYDTSLATSEDRDLLLRLSRLGQVGYYLRCIARKREHHANLTHARHSYRTLRNAFMVVAKQLDHAAELELGTDELAVTHKVLGSAARDWLYTASLAGLFEVRACMVPLLRHGLGYLLLDPRVWLRCLIARGRGSAA